MQISGIINLIYWSRISCLTAILWIMFQLGLFNHIPQNSPVYYASPFSAFLGAFLLTWTAPLATDMICSQIWNKITPIKSKPTFIENEIVYILSVLTGIPIYAALFLNLGIEDILRLLPSLSLAALPGSAIAYTLQIMYKDAIKTAHAQSLAEVDNHEAIDDIFHPETLGIMAYITASIAFNLIVLTLALLLIYLKIGFQPKGFQPKIFMSSLLLIGPTALIMSLFGQFLLQFGLAIKTTLGFTKMSIQKSITMGWFFSLILIVTTTAFIRLTNMHKFPTSLAALFEAWPYLLTYVIFLLGAYASGFILSRFHTPKPISAVFA